MILEDLAAIVGTRIRAARQARGLSIGALASTARVGKGSLSEIENGARNPTLSTVYAIADALGLPLASLLDERTGVRIASPGIEARLLDVHTDNGWIVEVYRLTLSPGSERRSRGHGAGVTEHLLLTAGRLRVGRAGEEVEVGVGQAAEWVSDMPHVYAPLGGEIAEAVLVIRSPQPTEPRSADAR